jgi:TolA-binding protein
MAQVYRDALGKRGDEADTYREFLKKYPGSVQVARAMWELAGSYRAQERNQDAMTTYGEIIAKFPKSDYAAAAMWELGQVQQVQGDAEKARATFEQLVKDKPGYVQADYARDRLAQK